MNAPDLRLPPHSLEAEQSLIGGLLLDRNAWDRIAGTVEDGDFYRDDHRRIFRHVALLAERGKPVDVVTVFESIERSNEVDQIGGLAYLGEIASNTPSAANIRHHAAIIREKSKLRQLLAVGDQLAAACMAPKARSVEDIAAEAEARFAELLDFRADEPIDLSDAFGEALAYIDARGDTSGLQTGFRHFDEMTGGLEPGQLIIIAARPSVGKTVIGVNIADHVARSGGAVLLHTMEMSRREIGMRILSARSGVSVQAMRSGTKEKGDWDRLAAQTADRQRLFIDDTPAVTVAQIRARARRIKRKSGLDLIVIDYLGLMRGQGDNRTQEIGSISRGLKALAKELQVPIIALAQLNRGVESRQDKRPLMSDLRDSGEVEQDADIVAMLHREALFNPAPEWASIAELLVRKNRNGPTGELMLSWWPHEMRFTDRAGPSPRANAINATNYQKPRQGGLD